MLIRKLVVPALAGLVVAAAGAAAQDTALTREAVASGLGRPLYVTHAPGDTGRIFIVNQRTGTTGSIRIVDLESGDLLSTPFLQVGPVSTANEQGLLGMAFHPDYADNGHFFINYTDSSGATVVARYQVSENDPNVADPDSFRLIMRIQQPFNNHNGGWIEFGPDGYLYIANGDGGSGGDPQNNSQNNGNLLGAMLRIDVDRDDFPANPLRNYGIPANNPFVGQAGSDEIWAYGLRNPWRNAFDRATGDLYIADVGQSAIEEINFQPASSAGGENYGWRCYEGSQPFNTSGCPPQSELVFPIFEYSRGGSPFRCSITGGEVYRGCRIPDLDGHYFYADLCSNQIWSFRYADGSVTDHRNHTPELGGLSSIVSFGLDARGDMYIAAFSNGGEVVRIVAADGSDACPEGGCSPADLAEPFGTLDIFDVLEFLDLFEQEDPRADLAEPFGTFDIFDVIEFLDIFEQGCP